MSNTGTRDRRGSAHGLFAKLIGQVQIDEAQRDHDLATAADFSLNSGYNDYSRGLPGWRNCVLMNDSGDPTDHDFHGYHGTAHATPFLGEIPYIEQLLRNTFNLDHLLWARLFICENGMLVPHRDYLDLPEDEFTRVHLALKLGEQSMHSENDQVFRMRQGEVWFIDGTVDHSAASYDNAPRTYLSCDFPADIPFDELISAAAIQNVAGAVPDIVARPPLPDGFDQDVDRFVSLIDDTMVDDAIAILSRMHYRYAARCGDVYDWIAASAERNGQPAVAARARDRRKFFLGA